jgi:hypothetical protein
MSSPLVNRQSSAAATLISNSSGGFSSEAGCPTRIHPPRIGDAGLTFATFLYLRKLSASALSRHPLAVTSWLRLVCGLPRGNGDGWAGLRHVPALAPGGTSVRGRTLREPQERAELHQGARVLLPFPNHALFGSPAETRGPIDPLIRLEHRFSSTATGSPNRAGLRYVPATRRPPLWPPRPPALPCHPYRRASLTASWPRLEPAPRSARARASRLPKYPVRSCCDDSMQSR